MTKVLEVVKRGICVTCERIKYDYLCDIRIGSSGSSSSGGVFVVEMEIFKKEIRDDICAVDM